MMSRRMLVATALGLGLVASCGNDGPATVPSQAAPDPGIAACQEAISTFQSGGNALKETTVAGWQASANPDLSAAAATILRIKALPPDQQDSEGDAIAEAVQQIGAGCLALGVAVPVAMLQIS